VLLLEAGFTATACSADRQNFTCHPNPKSRSLVRTLLYRSSEDSPSTWRNWLTGGAKNIVNYLASAGVTAVAKSGAESAGDLSSKVTPPVNDAEAGSSIATAFSTGAGHVISAAGGATRLAAGVIGAIGPWLVSGVLYATGATTVVGSTYFVGSLVGEIARNNSDYPWAKDLAEKTGIHMGEGSYYQKQVKPTYKKYLNTFYETFKRKANQQEKIFADYIEDQRKAPVSYGSLIKVEYKPRENIQPNSFEYFHPKDYERKILEVPNENLVIKQIDLLIGCIKTVGFTNPSAVASEKTTERTEEGENIFSGTMNAFDAYADALLLFELVQVNQSTRLSLAKVANFRAVPRFYAQDPQKHIYLPDILFWYDILKMMDQMRTRYTTPGTSNQFYFKHGSKQYQLTNHDTKKINDVLCKSLNKRTKEKPSAFTTCK
jgi:hypothetical protein